MRPLAGTERMRSIEAEAEKRFGLTSRLLMENAAAAIARALPEDAGKGRRALFLCGRGNNGGDGLAVATRLAHAGKGDIAIVIMDGEKSFECAFRLGIAERAGIRILAWPAESPEAEGEIARSGVIVEALSGTGLSSPLREGESSLVRIACASSAYRIALDVPAGFRTGMGKDDTVYAADETLCVAMDKAFLHEPAFRELAGEIRVVGEDVFPAEILNARAGDPLLIEESDARGMVPPFKRSAFKGSRGRVAVYSGSRGMAGAAFLASGAAARAGAGYVRLVTDVDVLPLVARRTGGVIVEAIGDNEKTLERSLQADVVLAGPGWGTSPERLFLLRAIIASGKPSVLDADALRLLSGLLPSPLSVLTPHPGEAAALLGLDSKTILERASSSARDIASSFRSTVVLKSSVTWIVSPEGESACVDGRFPGLGTAGSGDVLAGAIAGLMARGMDAFSAAKAGVLIHLEAGKRAVLKKGNILAEDILDELAASAKEAEGGGSHGRE